MRSELAENNVHTQSIKKEKHKNQNQNRKQKMKRKKIKKVEKKEKKKKEISRFVLLITIGYKL